MIYGITYYDYNAYADIVFFGSLSKKLAEDKFAQLLHIKERIDQARTKQNQLINKFYFDFKLKYPKLDKCKRVTDKFNREIDTYDTNVRKELNHKYNITDQESAQYEMTCQFCSLKILEIEEITL